MQMASETPSKTDVMTDFLTGITGHQLWRVQGNEVPGVSPQRRVSVGSDSQMSRVQEQESVPLNSPEIIENRSHCAVGEDGLHQPLATGVESLSVLAEAANNVGQDLDRLADLSHAAERLRVEGENSILQRTLYIRSSTNNETHSSLLHDFTDTERFPNGLICYEIRHAVIGRIFRSNGAHCARAPHI